MPFDHRKTAFLILLVGVLTAHIPLHTVSLKSVEIWPKPRTTCAQLNEATAQGVLAHGDKELLRFTSDCLGPCVKLLHVSPLKVSSRSPSSMKQVDFRKNKFWGPFSRDATVSLRKITGLSENIFSRGNRFQQETAQERKRLRTCHSPGTKQHLQTVLCNGSTIGRSRCQYCP